MDKLSSPMSPDMFSPPLNILLSQGLCILWYLKYGSHSSLLSLAATMVPVCGSSGLAPLINIIQEFEPLQRHRWLQVPCLDSSWHCLEDVVSKDYIIHHRGDPESTLSCISRWTCEAKLQVAVACVLSLTVFRDCHGHKHQSGAQRNRGSLHCVGLATFTYPFYLCQQLEPVYE